MNKYAKIKYGMIYFLRLGFAILMTLILSNLIENMIINPDTTHRGSVIIASYITINFMLHFRQRRLDE